MSPYELANQAATIHIAVRRHAAIYIYGETWKIIEHFLNSSLQLICTFKTFGC